MNIGGSPFVVRRILVAVDASAGSINLLESAATLAAGLNAEVSAIFVEDVNLLRLAGLPFAREVAWSSAAVLHLDYHRMERVLRGRATHAQQAVSSATARLKLQGSLQIARGQIVTELLQAAAGTDLLLLGKGGALGKRLGDVALRMALEAPCSVLLQERDPDRHLGSLGVDFAGHERDERLLIAAAQIARAMHIHLLVLIPAGREADYLRLRDAVQGLLGKEFTFAACLPVKHTGTRPYQDLLRDAGVGMVALDAGGGNSAGLEHKITALDYAVLLIR